MASDDIDIFAVFSKSDVLTAADGQPYEESIRRWGDNAVRRARFVVLPHSAQDVSKAIRFAVEHKLEIAIKGGGHSTSGASSSDDLVIDLCRLASVSVDPTRQTVTVGGGALWADVDPEVGRYGLAVVGGTVNHTGVGGLTLGGGYSWLTGRHGHTVDNLIAAELVLANGDVINCSNSENADLFWAIRGAGSNFGPVTKFTFKAHPQQNTVWSGFIFYHPSKLDEVIQAAQDWSQGKESNDKESVSFVFSHSPDTLEPIIVVVPFYNGPESEGRKAFEGFLRIEHLVDLTNEHPYAEQNSLLNESTPYGGRKLLRGSHITTVDLQLARYLWDGYVALAEKYPEVKKSIGNYPRTDDPYGKTMSVPTSATAFAHRGPFYNVFFIMQWEDPSLDGTMRAWSAEKAKHIQEVHAKAVGPELAQLAGYSNYGGEDANLVAVFGDNLGRLRALKERYDPGNVFRKWQSLFPEVGAE